MLDRLHKLYTQNKTTAYKDIWLHQKKEKTTLINFLYFANIVKNKIPASHKTIEQKTYYHNITTGDFLFPDGIALQAFYTLAYLLGYLAHKKIPNLNGTDFVPYFLQKCKDDKKKIRIHLYGASPDTVTVAAAYFKQYASIGYVHHGYGNLDDQQVSELVQHLSPQHTNILLIGRGTPIQENRAAKYKHFLPNTIIYTVGGLFDFVTGTEKRAPLRVRGRGEWLYRLISNPRKNAHKVRYTLGWIPYVFGYLLLKRLTDSIRSR